MARPGRPERSRTARSAASLGDSITASQSDEVFGTHSWRNKRGPRDRMISPMMMACPRSPPGEDSSTVSPARSRPRALIPIVHHADDSQAHSSAKRQVVCWAVASPASRLPSVTAQVSNCPLHKLEHHVGQPPVEIRFVTELLVEFGVVLEHLSMTYGEGPVDRHP
jgi:hypothetical protein